MDLFEDYLKAIKSFKVSEVTESSHRRDLQNLLEVLAKEVNPKIKILHEPKREGKFGSPDYKVTIADNIIGYVENKAIDEDLDKVLKSEQIEKYKSLSNNLILTNYIEFVWIKDGIVTKKEKFAYLTDYGNIKIDLNKKEAVKNLIRNFFSQAPKGISSSKKLAEALAVRAKLLKDFLLEELKRQEEEHLEGKLYGLYQTFKKYVFNELSIAEFSDTFAQNLVYGLFLAKLNANEDTINLYNAKKYISYSFELIKELVGFLDELDNEEYKEARWIVEEVLTVLNNLDLMSIKGSLSFKEGNKTEDFLKRDPYIYFYEDFLASYDKKLKKAKGVYYTPSEIVSFIIKTIDKLLQKYFNLEDGLANHNKVNLLDFATGTGTFLLETCKVIFEKIPANSGKKELIISNHILKNIYGFEYMIAPYTIAHLRLSEYLKSKNYYLSNKERFQIFLTNTLEPINKQMQIPILPALTNETIESQKVKDKPILVIVGNPPYLGHSKNNGDWINKNIQDYYYIDGKRIKEKNTKWLKDDYVKFIRFAQYKIDQIENGIVGVITNHSFLDNPTFRAMRKNLMETFDQIYVVDLHGNHYKREKTPNGSKDENVFDQIKQGVAISIFIKNRNLEKKIYHTDFWGLRSEKYRKCQLLSIDDIEWEEFIPSEPFYLFKFHDSISGKRYKKGYSLNDIFNISGNGIITKRDKLVISFDKETLLKNLKKFSDVNYSDFEIASFFNLPLIDKDKWNLSKARKNIIENGIQENKIMKFLYRPFDKRYLYYDDTLVARLVEKISKNMKKENIALIVGRYGSAVSQEFMWNIAFISNTITDLNLFYRGGAKVFPLYIYEDQESILYKNEKTKYDNLNIDFKKYLCKYYNCDLMPEQIISYMYSLLFSPSYRIKYHDFLNIDFPNILIPKSKEIFKGLSKLGQDLINAHLFISIPSYGIGNFMGNGNNMVENIKLLDNKMFINDFQYFNFVNDEIYRFFIGGYQVIDLYLKYRKGKVLTLEEIENIENTIKVIAFTIDQMKKIDDLTKDWI